MFQKSIKPHPRIDCEKAFVTSWLLIELISLLFIKIQIDKKNSPIEKWTKEMKEKFTEEEIKMPLDFTSSQGNSSF